MNGVLEKKRLKNIIKHSNEFTNKGNLQSHIKLQHEKHGKVQIKCESCNYVATKKERLTIHVRVKHLKELYKCSHCDYKAKYSSSLYHHVSSFHNGIKYKCPQCECETSSKSFLKNHIKSSHMGE